MFSTKTLLYVLILVSIFAILSRLRGNLKEPSEEYVWVGGVLKEQIQKKPRKLNPYISFRLEEYPHHFRFRDNVHSLYSIATKHPEVIENQLVGQYIEIQIHQQYLDSLKNTQTSYLITRVGGLRTRDKTFFTVEEVNADTDGYKWIAIPFFSLVLVISVIALWDLYKAASVKKQ